MVKKLFGHIAVGDTPDILAAVRTSPDINGAILQKPFAPVLQSYMQSLTIQDLKLNQPLKEAYTYDGIGKYVLFTAGETSAADVKNILLAGFPDRPGIDELAAHVTTALSDFSAATGYKTLTGDINLSLPSPSCWHRDNATDIRGFVAYNSDGPLLRANSTVEDWNRELNNFGIPAETQLPPEVVTQLKTGELGIWKGDYHQHPLIHVKPVTAPGEMRISMIINPVAEEEAAMTQKLGLKKFTAAP